MIVPPEASTAQHRSSNPETSVWVSANAGAGKTYVLAQRVVRLLLAGVEPGSILCLTYTNAAAAEMAGRVFKELGELATLPQKALLQRVAKLAPEVPAEAAALRARTLFARTLETPGGIKVQTVHAFAATLLRRFPLEADVSGAFKILDEATRTELADRAVATTLGEGAQIPDGPVAAAIREVVPFVSDASLGAAIKAMLAEREAFAPWLHAGEHPDRLAKMLAEALGLDETAPVGDPLEEADCRALIARAREGGKSLTRAALFEEALLTTDPTERAARWRAAFLTQKGEPVAKLFAPAILTPELADCLTLAQARVLEAVEAENARAVVAASVPLARLAYRVFEKIDREKRRRGLVDYDDQIEKAMNLVKGTSAAAWVRYKLDEGIDHIMLDEAQDTSPPQWDLVDALTGEFFAGASSRPVHRTLFVVGDEKQSIYSFQGAAPELFARMRGRYGDLAAGAEKPFEPVDLAHSFRSAPQVLAAVDRVFAEPALAASVGATASAVRHVAVRGVSGGVDVWPLLANDESDASTAWDEPLDQRADSSGYVKLARAIADQIEAWRIEGPDGGAPVDPGGVMILSRKREPFASLMNRELKARGIPAAGSDRLDVTKHIAVQDMLALARALISTDDLSLAAVLKSPLFGFDDDALFALAHGREGSLFGALAEGDETARAAHATLTRWARLAHRGRPFDLFASILVGEGRRTDFAARMGSEAEDALDAFLDIALDFEGKGIPAMEPFLMRLSKMSSEISRTAEGAAGKVRVMTVHGSKGLEADVVFLADVGSGGNQRSGPTVLRLPHREGEVLALAPASDSRPRRIAAALEERKDAEAREHHRLLYVGMTRAERHLVVCGAYGSRKPQRGMWHEVVTNALTDMSETRTAPVGEILAWRNPAPSPEAISEREDTPQPAPEAPPAWLLRPAAPLKRAPEPITPSGEHDLPIAIPGNDRPLPAAVFGSLIHDLIERGGPVEALVAEVRRRHGDLSPAAARAIAEEAAAARALPQLAGREAMQEIDVIGDVVMASGVVRRAMGRVDWIGTDTAGDVLVVDFKTDRAVPLSPTGVPAAYRQQLAIYRALLEPMFGRAVRTGLVFTAEPLFLAMDEAVPKLRAAKAPT